MAWIEAASYRAVTLAPSWERDAGPPVRVVRAVRDTVDGPAGAEDAAIAGAGCMGYGPCRTAARTRGTGHGSPAHLLPSAGARRTALLAVHGNPTSDPRSVVPYVVELGIDRRCMAIPRLTPAAGRTTALRPDPCRLTGPSAAASWPAAPPLGPPPRASDS